MLGVHAKFQLVRAGLMLLGCLKVAAVLGLKLSGELSELFAIERQSIVHHDYSWHAFSGKQVSQVHQCLGVMCGCYSVEVLKLTGIICNDKKFVV